MKRLLFVSRHIPFPPTDGGMIRTYSLLRALQRDWIIDYVTFRKFKEPLPEVSVSQSQGRVPNLTFGSFDVAPDLVEMLRGYPNLWPLLWLRDKLKSVDGFRPIFWLANIPFMLQMHRRVRKVIKNKLRSEHFDVVLFDYTKMAWHFGLVKDKRTKKILNVHNAESDLARQQMLNQKNRLVKAMSWLQWKLFENYERLFIAKCDLLLAPSQADADFYQRLAPNIRTAIIPNAVDTENLRPLPPPKEEPFSLIYTGTMAYPPNVQAVQSFCQEILPRIVKVIPPVRFYIVGKNPPLSVQKLRSERVVVTGCVDDMLPFWRKACVLVTPLKMGGGTRIKILEAMALGRPVVSTSKGCEGLDVLHGTHILVADDSEKFAHYVTRLLRDAKLCQDLTLAARRLVEEKYSFASIESLLRKSLEKL